MLSSLLNRWRGVQTLKNLGSYLEAATDQGLSARQVERLKIEPQTVVRGKKLRKEDFERDYPALLITLASTIRTGQEPLRALCESKKLFAEGSAMHAVLQDFQSLLDEGKSERDAIAQFGCRVEHPDLAMFRLAFTLALSEGASLAPSLQRLARSTRQRQSFRRKIRSSLAMQRLSAWGIFACAFFLVGFQFLTQEGSLRLVQEQLIGMLSLGIGALLLVLGLLWMFRIARIQV